MGWLEWPMAICQLNSTDATGAAKKTALRKRVTINDLLSLGNQLQLPKDWKYQVQILTQNLSLNSIPSRVVHVVQDDLHHTFGTGSSRSRLIRNRKDIIVCHQTRGRELDKTTSPRYHRNRAKRNKRRKPSHGHISHA